MKNTLLHQKTIKKIHGHYQKWSHELFHSSTNYMSASLWEQKETSRASLVLLWTRAGEVRSEWKRPEHPITVRDATFQKGKPPFGDEVWEEEEVGHVWGTFSWGGVEQLLHNCSKEVLFEERSPCNIWMSLLWLTLNQCKQLFCNFLVKKKNQLGSPLFRDGL